MKKLFIVSLALLTSLIAQAQIVSSSSRSIIVKPVERNTVFYLKGGLAFQTWTGKDAKDFCETNPGSGVGYDVLFGFQKDFSFLNGLYWGPEVGLGSRGMKLSFSEGSVSESVTAMMNALKITPVQLGYKYDITSLLTIDAHIGFLMSVDLFGGMYYKYSYGKESDSSSENLSELNELMNYKRFDIGINPGITLWIGKLGVDFTYQKGFLSMVGDQAKVYSQNLLLRLAYRF
ncbi:MAG: outer membrane beta-barrel protein [Bacteroidales bacterium]|nr:outer membrane beta-barrel protein [Bacteroidales bacterium]